METNKTRTGKKAVVVGGTHGMGLAIVKALLGRGTEVLLTGRNDKTLEAARSKLSSAVHVLKSDASSMADIYKLGVLAKEKLDQVDALFINVGISELVPFENVTEDSYDRAICGQHQGRVLHRATPRSSHPGGRLDRFYHGHQRAGRSQPERLRRIEGCAAGVRSSICCRTRVKGNSGEHGWPRLHRHSDHGRRWTLRRGEGRPQEAGRRDHTR